MSSVERAPRTQSVFLRPLPTKRAAEMYRKRFVSRMLGGLILFDQLKAASKITKHKLELEMIRK